MLVFSNNNNNNNNNNSNNNKKQDEGTVRREKSKRMSYEDAKVNTFKYLEHCKML